VDDAARMGVRQGPADLSQHPGRLEWWQRAVPADALAEGLALDIRHDEVREGARLLDRVDRDDVGV
jgi:hypothetical protein